jgi:hypothetical protein
MSALHKYDSQEYQDIQQQYLLLQEKYSAVGLDPEFHGESESDYPYGEHIFDKFLLS